MTSSSTWQDAFDDFGRQAQDWYSAFAKHARSRGIRSLVEPVDPYNRSRVLGPAIAAAGVVAVVVLGGVVVAASVIATAALLAVIFLLTEVFGYDLSLVVPSPPTA